MDKYLGKFVRDKYTEFEGTVIGKKEFVYGDIQYCVVPHSLAITRFEEGVWINEGRLEIVKKEDVTEA